jgi:acyl-CoA synthetase (AMP-forming)/AMP-acid ligase II
MSLFGWLSDPDGRSGIRVLTSAGDWRYTPYDELAGLVATAARLCADRDRAGTIAVCCADPRNFIAALFGGLITGARVCGLPPPLPFGSQDRYERVVTERLAMLNPALVLCDAATREAMAALVPDGTPWALVPERAAGARPEPARGGRIVQFTSGSASSGKSIVIDGTALESNVTAIRKWLALGEGDGTSSWLPLHHDMGLVGCMMTPLTGQNPIWFMSPQQFVRRPGTWLRTFGDGATTTAAPPFGYEHCLLHVDGDTALDLARWRVAIIGAERIRPGVLRAFADRFAADGFAFDAFRPSYGLAEATLAVTGRRPADPVRTIEVERASIIRGEPVRPAGPRAHPVAVLGCGRPLDGCAVEIRGPDGAVLGPGHTGEIVVRGPALGRYEHAGPQGEGTRFEDGAVWTGDLGFLDDGELFCIGRIGDGVKVRGQFVAAETIEQSVADDLGVPSGSAVALLGMDGDTARLGILVDQRTAAAPGHVHRAARSATTGTGIEITVCLCPPRAIERTTSGKPRRRSMWSRFVSGDYDEYASCAKVDER